MNNSHLIDSAVFDTTFTGRAVAFEQRAQIEEFMKTELMQVVDEVFEQVDSDFDVPGSVMLVQNIEIDLGSIPCEDYRQQMPRILREQLLQALALPRQAGSDPTSAAILVDTRGAQLAQLFHFLTHGYLPWYSSTTNAMDVGNFDSLMVESIESSPEAWLEFISRHRRGTPMLRRLVQQFSASGWQRVTQLLSTQPGDWAREILTELERVTLELESAVPQAAEPLAEQQTGQTIAAESAANLIGRFIAALEAGKAKDIGTLWRPLYDNHSELLAKTLRRHGQLATSRRHILAGLSTARRVELLRLLEPRAQGLLRSLIDDVKLWAPAGAGIEPVDVPSLEELWEYSLGYLLVERGRRFDVRSFIFSVLRQFAASTRQPPAALLAGFVQNLDRAGDTSQVRELYEQLQLSTALTRPTTATGRADASRPVDTDEMTDRAEPAEPGSAPDSIDAINALETFEAPEEFADVGHDTDNLTEAYRRYTMLKSILTTGPGDEVKLETELLADIKALTSDAPWLLLRLYRELQSGAIDRSPAIAELPGAVLRELCYSLLSLNAEATATLPYGSASELVDAIRAGAAMSENRQAFFAQVLGHLVNDELIDLENIHGPQSSGQDVVDMAAQVPGIDGKAGPALSPIPASTTSLMAMAATARQQLLLSAELITTAACTTDISLSAERLEAIKHEFIQAYVTGTGYLFHQGYFVQQFVDNLVLRAGARDADKFRVLLGEELLRNSLPTTSTTTQRLIEILAAGVSEIPRPVAQPPGKAFDVDDEPAILEDIYVANAGLVLLAAYVPRLFEKFGLIRNGEFTGREAAERAVHCLQFLVNESLNSPEYQLVLNKLLCGVKPGLPICRGIELSVGERDQLEALLRAVTQHWKPLNNSSPDALRESFLQRNGRLQLKNDAWHLTVEARPFDMLLDQLPWSFSTIKFAWMERVVFVEWR